MTQIVLIGLGAGSAAALLFASVASGSILATFLFYLSPLPILIVTLGWSQLAGLVAAGSATAGLAVIPMAVATLGDASDGASIFFYLATTFLVGVGLPAWWL